METKSQAFRWERSNAPREDWRNLILASSQEVDVVELVRDHLARWTPAELVGLPLECHPPRIRDAEDISGWAFELATTHCAQSGMGTDDPMLERMLEFVTQAAIRISELRAEAARTELS
ncbi:MAG TPA: hypothetical protein VFV90_03035 [Usitatibacter sp.]|nr:hypothetical protein [Usitatibacter sp.]